MITLVYHAEFVDDDDDVAVWVDSPDLAGFSACAGSVHEVRRLAGEMLEAEGIHDEIVECLDGVEPGGTAIRVLMVGGGQPIDAAFDFDGRQTDPPRLIRA